MTMPQRYLLANSHFSSDNFADTLRETILQDPSEIDHGGPLVAEIVAQFCFELAYNATSPWRDEGYALLNEAYFTTYGSRSIQHLARNGPLIRDLAMTTFAT
jgi:hypothetical protein